MKRAIINFTGDRYSRNEYFVVYREFEKNNKEGEFVRELENQWREIDESKSTSFDNDRSWNKILKSIGFRKTKHKILIWQVAQRVAAILFLPLLFSSLFYFYSVNKDTGKEAFAEIQCPMGVRTKFALPDGTTGYLNSGSSLKYPVNFVKLRNVEIQGEAYFDVFHDKKNPFVVQTSNLNVKVLGTKFNVTAYDDELSEQVVLNEGKVNVLSKNGNPLSILKTGQRLILDTGKMSYRTETVSAKRFSSWTEGKLIFRDENIQQIMARLSRWYNVDLKLEDEELLKYTFRATFVDEPIEEIFKLLALSAPVQFEELTREATPDDGYKKRRIIIRLDQDRLSAFKK